MLVYVRKTEIQKSLFSDEFTSAWHAWQSVSEVKYPFLIAGANSSKQAASLTQEAPAPASYSLSPD